MLEVVLWPDLNFVFVFKLPQNFLPARVFSRIRFSFHAPKLRILRAEVKILKNTEDICLFLVSSECFCVIFFESCVEMRNTFRPAGDGVWDGFDADNFLYA